MQGADKTKRCIESNDVLRIEMPHNNAHAPVYYFTCFPSFRKPTYLTEPEADYYDDDDDADSATFKGDRKKQTGYRLMDQLMALTPHYTNIFPMRSIKTVRM